MDIEIRLLRYLAAVAEEHSFTLAAERLAMTQPALSRAIRSLERAAGVDLLIRGPHGVEPTAAGRVLLDETRGVGARIQAAVQQAQAASRGEDRLRLAAPGCDVAIAADLAAGFRPGPSARNVHVDITARDADPPVGSLRQGSCDVALIRGPFDATDLDREPLWTEPRVALLPSTHPLAGASQVDLGQLRDDPVTLWPSMTPAEQRYWAGADTDGHAWPMGPLVTSASDVVAAVRLGQAVAFVASSQAPGHSAIPGLKVCPVRGLSASTLYVAWAAAATSPHIAAFVRYAADHARQLYRTRTAGGL